MKKHFLKSFALLAMLFSTLSMSAISYCGETITSTDGTRTAVITCTQPEAGTYVMTVTSSEANFYGLKIKTGTTTFNLDGTSVRAVNNTTNTEKLTCSWASPILTITLRCTGTPVMTSNMCLNFGGSEKEFDALKDQVFEWPTSCEAGEEEPEVTDKWANVDWVGASDNKYKVSHECLSSVVNVQQPPWAAEKGIYVTAPAGISSCTVNGAIDGAGMILYLSSFTAKETEVTITHGLGTCTFWVYYADGTEGGGEGGETPDPTPEPEEPEVTDKWADVDWLGASDNKYKVSHECLSSVVNVQQPPWAAERGIYVTAPAGISSCTVNGAIDGAGMILYLSSFTAKETEVTITHGLGSCTFWVYYADGTEGGTEGGETPGEGGEDPEPTPEPELEPSTYCQTPLTVGANTIYLTTEKVSDGNYRMTVEGENLSGFGGTFYNPGEKDLRDAITSQTSTKIICDIAAASAPIFYTPLYVNMPGEVNFSELNGKNIIWGKCEVSDLAYSDLAIVSPSALSHSLAIGETFTIGLSTSSTGAITYTSSNTEVAEVSASGVITAKAIGTTTITVSQSEDANYQAGEKSFTLNVIAAAIPSNKGFGTYQGRVDLYDWIGDYAGNNACGQVDLYVVTWGNDVLYKAKVVDNKFEDGTDWKCQLRTRNAELSGNPLEYWAKAIADDGATRYSEYGNTYHNHSGLVGYGETFNMWSYMVIAGCGARTMKTLTYTRDHINNPIADNTAPTLSGAANVTSTAENITIALPTVTSEEVFYMIKDEAHNKQYISITPSFVLPKDGSGITYTYSCYAVDFNGNMSAPLTAEVSMPFNATSNLALNKPCQAGHSTNNDRLASKANDGDINSRWSSEHGNNPTDAWWYVDLGESYNLSTIEISWEGACATDYVIMGSDEYIDPTNATAWQTATTLVAKTTAPTVGNNTQEVYSVTGQHARYLRLQANTLANNDWGCSFYEFRVFGTGVYDPSAAADTEKPVITSATPKTPIAHNEVQITMVASDNVGVVSYEVKDDAKGVSATCVPVDNVITVSNLQEQTTYNLSIVAVDAVGNKSDAYAMAAFTTSINPYIPHEATPVPTRDAEDVLAFYSDTYTPVINWGNKKDWNGAGTVTENAISANNYLMYKDVTWWGWTYGVKDGYTNGTLTGVDCSNMEYLHIDVWGPIDGKIRVIPIYGGGVPNNENYYAEVTIKAGQWNSVDVALADFVGAGDKHDFSSIYQIKFAELNIETVSIDNVYFWKSAGTLPVESVTLDKTTATIEVDEALQLKATVLPTDAANKNVVWTSSNTSVATVSAEGIVTGLTVGTTTITATSEDDNTKVATCAITVEPITVKTWWGGPVTLTLAGQEHYVLYSFTRNENKTITYTAIFDQGNLDIVKQVNISGVYNALEWMDADKTTASWTSTTTHNAGEKILGFFFFGGPRINFDTEAIAYIVGSSNERPILSVESVTLDKTSCELMPTETAQLIATVNPGYVANKNVVWTSSNTAVATVDANGLVTAVAAGSATITATSVADNTKTATCTVNVMAELTGVTYHASTYVKKDANAYLGINYSITRTSNRTLCYVVKVNNSEDVDLEFNVVVDGIWKRMEYNASANTYTYTTITTYADGDVVSGFFRQIKYGTEGRWDFNYEVGSTSTTPRTMVAVNDEDADLTHLNNGSVYDVILKRNFVMDNDWNTISLPFALTADQVKEVFGEGTTLTKLASSTLISSTEVDILFEEVTSIEVATPYLIKPEKNVNEGVLLENVTINTTPNILEAGITKMIPVLKTENFTGQNNTFFLGANDNLYNRSADGKIKGMRAYFQFSTLTPEQLRNVRARVVFNENVETSVDNLITDEAPVKMIQNGHLIIIRNGIKYNIQGQKL